MWLLDEPVRVGQALIVGRDIEYNYVGPRGDRQIARLPRGLFYRDGAQVPLSALVGMAIPFLLASTAILLPFEWRRRDRMARGACHACGYICVPPKPCPECGNTTPVQRV